MPPAGPRYWVRRSRIPGRRSCTWPPTVRWVSTTGPTTASSAPLTELPSLVSGFGPEWVGVSVTMPGKFAALRVRRRADRHVPQLVGSANTLVRTERGWRADNTDIDGVAGALGRCRAAASCSVPAAPRPRRSPAWRQLGVDHVTVVARNPDKAARLLELADTARDGRAVLRARRRRPGRRCIAGRPWWSARCPPTSPRGTPTRLRPTPVLLDAIYDPWPTPLASAVTAAGGRVVSGLQMLLYPGLRRRSNNSQGDPLRASRWRPRSVSLRRCGCGPVWRLRCGW